MTVKNPTILSLFLKALFPRFLFLAHGMICIWLLVKQKEENNYWYLVTCLILLVGEGIFNVLIRHGKEFHWFCPSAFLYAVVLIVTMSVLREGQLRCLGEKPIEKSYCTRPFNGTDSLTLAANSMSYELRESIVEQTGLLVLIIGRWLLPQGHISQEAFSQILLIYIGTAADIVEFSEIYGEDDVIKLGNDQTNVLNGVMAVWALSVVQFSFTIALPEEGIRDEVEEEEEEDELAEASYFRGKMTNKVAPMSYMHYKSMLREGFANGHVAKLKRDPTEAQIAFREKYKSTSKTLESLRLRSGTYDKETGKRRSPPSRLPPLSNRKSKSPSLLRKNPGKSVSYTADNSSSRVKLPQGDRMATSVGSPTSVRSVRMGTPRSIHSSESLSSPKSPQSVRSSKSNDSKQHNFSTENHHKENAWRKLIDQTPFSRKRVKNRKRKDSTKIDNSLGIGKKEINNCFLKYLDLIGILMPICLQDGPFFIIRFVLVAHYQVVTQMIILLTIKNALVIIIQIYRILLMYCVEPQSEPDIDDASVRIRTAMSSNKKLSDTHPSFKHQRTSLAIQAIARLQRGNSHDQNDTLQNGNVNMQSVREDVVVDVKPE